GLASGDYAFGRVTGATNTFIQPRVSGSASAAFRINATSGITSTYTGDRAGAWSVRCSLLGNLRAYHDKTLVATSDEYVMETLANSEFSVARQGNAYAAFSCGGWFIGGSMSTAQMHAMSAIVNAHVAMFSVA